ncbi:GGDEF domain-containing protein [Prodigiosinella confusarubida]|uniref:diguanylate cyclase n=1 Tax=Serratia sp. (strain ATCC 39006) TaxID=104623 RepID=A0A2I5TB11_SERS3|nr:MULTISPECIES: GGDEF domain-containing protein [Enterobacterales]AUH01757.1 GGDEF domain-containing protein [Serratia sp. ATCC 39006]AUH06080.1 GGDEF domain-containing protein [Serratia sp. ATCC 39006]WJV55008.1 GGDEF domain-containing protein [Prodigiosinella sp. LS101]WJV59368.1 GGDEF domain-containing protein [Pectobacteriaceae bacterium C111]
MSTNELFTPEYDILLSARHVAAQLDMPAEIYRDNLMLLSEHYQRLVRETYRLITRSDRAEKELTRLNTQLHTLAVELEYKATHDPLTDIFNRRAIIDLVDETLAQKPAALIVLDIDHFKQVNDTFGHPTGDTVICNLVSRIREVLQGQGYIGRVGGEEFTILLSEYTLMQAVSIAEQIHHSLNQTPLLPQRKVTASFGISWTPAQARFDTLYSIADNALYRAKNKGRNRVEYSVDAIIE